MQIGLVGLPSAGKSTFFSAATLVDVEMANYPFTTIEPNKGTGFVRVDDPASFFNVVSNPRSGFVAHGTRFVPVELIDVAGLVEDAYLGKGLGNKFLNDLSQADALIHVVDVSGSTDLEGKPCSPGSSDPVKHVSLLVNEIDMWFFSIISKNWAKIEKNPAKEKSKKLELLSQILSGLKIRSVHIEKAMSALSLFDKQFSFWSDEDKKNFAIECRKFSKPIIIAANKADIPSSKDNISSLKSTFPNLLIVPCSAVSELALRKAAKDDFIEYFPGDSSFKILKPLSDKQKSGLDIISSSVLSPFSETGVQKCIDLTVFSLLNFVAVFPGGVKKLSDSQGRILPDCFLLPPNSTALDFAFALHTDMGRGFIKAIDVKSKQMVSKEHVLKTGDVIEIVFRKPD